MKIGNTGEPNAAAVTASPSPGLAKAGETGVAGAPTGAHAGAASPVGQETVALSPASQSLQEAGAPFDAAKVKSVTDALARGSFTVQAQRIADRLISNAAELLERIAQVKSRDK